MHTWMRYGPIDLTGAIDAKATFFYWLDTEPIYDYFIFGYSCDGLRWKETSVSGSIPRWKKGTMELGECANKPKVHIRFVFTSDSDGSAFTGVWVDDIKIRKLS